MPFHPDTYFMPDGSAAAPGMAFEAEPTTGLYRKSAGVLGIAVGGTEVGTIDSNGLGGGVYAKGATFTENGAGTYTGSVNVPAGADILDIIVQSTALWTAATSALMDVGDVADPDGWYAAVNLKATDLLVGEDLSFEHPGGKAGVYLASEQRVRYSASARVISGVITSVGSGTAGRTRMTVVFAVPVMTTATKA